MRDEEKLELPINLRFLQTDDEGDFFTIILLFHFENFFNFLQNFASNGIIEDRRQFDFFIIQSNERILGVITKNEAFKEIEKLYTDLNLLDVIISDPVDFFDGWESYYEKQMNQILFKIKQIANDKRVLGKSYPQIAETVIDSEVFPKEIRDSYANTLEFSKQMKLYLLKKEELKFKGGNLRFDGKILNLSGKSLVLCEKIFEEKKEFKFKREEILELIYGANALMADNDEALRKVIQRLNGDIEKKFGLKKVFHNGDRIFRSH
jgi:hypothetical protein